LTVEKTTVTVRAVHLKIFTIDNDFAARYGVSWVDGNDSSCSAHLLRSNLKLQFYDANAVVSN